MQDQELEMFTAYSRPPCPGTINDLPDLCQQHFKNEVDINEIIARAERTGFIGDPLRPGTRQPTYGDFTGIKDFQEAKNLIIAANDAFMQIPAETRARFNNDPGELIAFMDNPENKAEAIELGLIEDDSPKPQPIPVGAPVEPPKTV